MPAQGDECHREMSAMRMDGAREALLGGKTSTLAYSLDIDEADVEQVGGISSDQLGYRSKIGQRRPRRATTSE
jgi:hypothetical protein